MSECSGREKVARSVPSRRLTALIEDAGRQSPRLLAFRGLQYSHSMMLSDFCSERSKVMTELPPTPSWQVSMGMYFAIERR